MDKKPDIENIDSIIKYQELYELHIDVIFNKIKPKINQTALEEILIKNYLEGPEQASIMYELQIENAENIILHNNQRKQKILEKAIELLEKNFTTTQDDNKLYNQKIKRPPNKQTIQVTKHQ